jgi:receptor protein-tyrosine kinase
MPGSEGTLIERIEAAAEAGAFAIPAAGADWPGARPDLHAWKGQRVEREAPPASTEAKHETASTTAAALASARAEARAIPQPGAAATVFDLPLAELAQEGFVTPLAPRGVSAEEMRLIKQGLFAQFHRSGRPRIVLATSPDRGAGKSFFALNLALSLAVDERVETALIDADPYARRPWPLGIERSPGLTDLLQGRPNSAAWRRAAQLPLSFLPFGNAVDAPGTLLASDVAARFFRAAAARFEWVIFDGPPVRKASGAGALASLAGQIIIVAGSENTTGRALREALERLGGRDEISLVLNGAPSGAAGDWPPLTPP